MSGSPHGHDVRDVPFLPPGCPGWIGPVDWHRADGQVVPVPGDHHRCDVFHERRSIGRYDRSRLSRARRCFGQRDFVKVLERTVDRGEVALDELGALSPVGRHDSVLDSGDGLVSREDARNREEAGLHDRVDPARHASLDRDPVAIDHEEADLFSNQIFLHAARQLIPDRFWAERAVDEQHRAVDRLAQQVDPIEELKLMARNELRPLHEIGRANWTGTEAEVRGRPRSGFLRVVDEEALCVAGCVFSDDLDRILVGANRPVGSETVEDAADDVAAFRHEIGVVLQARVRDVVSDADGEVVFRVGCGEVVEDRLDHRGRELLRREPVAAAENPRHRRAAGGDRLGEACHDILIERLTGGTRLLRAIEYGDRCRRRWDGVDELADRERAKQAHLEHAELFATAVEVLDRFTRRLGPRAHQHDHAIRIRRAEVIEEPVTTAGECREPVHRRLQGRRKGSVEPVHGLARLKVHVGILRDAANGRMIRVERSSTMSEHQFVVNHRPHVVVGEHLDLADLVRGPEAVEEVHERNARGQGCALRNEREVVRFLHGARAQHRPAGHARRHHVRVVAENRQRLRGQRAGRHVEHRRRELSGDLEHVGDHEEQALRRREGCRQRTRLQGAVDGAGRAPFALHLNDVRHVAPDVLPAF